MTFEYDVVKIPVQAFQHLAFFCSRDGECALDDVPTDQAARLTDILNEKGAEGWELVQLFFDPSGVVAIWKRSKKI
jgi:hypothetical protein